MIIWPPSAVNDLPIPSTFGQAALHAGAAGAAVFGAEKVGGMALGAVAAVPVAGTAGAAGVIGAPVLLLRRRVRRVRVRGRGRGRGGEEPSGGSGLCRGCDFRPQLRRLIRVISRCL
jgi:hypothetical protein